MVPSRTEKNVIFMLCFYVTGITFRFVIIISNLILCEYVRQKVIAAFNVPIVSLLNVVAPPWIHNFLQKLHFCVFFFKNDDFNRCPLLTVPHLLEGAPHRWEASSLAYSTRTKSTSILFFSKKDMN